MVSRSRTALFIAGIAFLAVSGVHAYRFHTHAEKDIFWTPMPMATPPSELSDRVEVYHAGQLVMDNIDERPVIVRLNNKAQVTQRAWGEIGFLLGLGVALVVVSAIPAKR